MEASGASAHSAPAVGSQANNNTNGTTGIGSPLSPGSSQLYKQRSIRATLAPKYASGANSPGASEHPSPAHSIKAEPQQSSPNSAASSASSVDSAEPKLAYHNSGGGGQGNASRPLQPEASGNLRDATSDPVKKVASSSAGPHPSTSGPQQHRSSSKSKSQQQSRTQSDSSRSHASSSSQSHLDQVSTNESYVSVLNHCFDDIEKFIIRLQQAVAAIHELQAKRKLSKRSSHHQTANGKGGELGGSGGVSAVTSSPPMTASELAMLNSRARGPSEDDYFEILSKFKLAFNLLAKLKGCIHEPNAPELVHFLFTPLAIIIESARNATPPVDPTLVGIPYLNQDALDLLSNCCTSKESDMWISLGPNWTQTIDMNLLKASRLPSSFQPIFSDGWAPIISELELIGLVATTHSNDQTAPIELIDSNNHHNQHHNNNNHHHHHRPHHPGHSHDRRRGQAANYNIMDEGGPSMVEAGYSLDHPSGYLNGKGAKNRGGHPAEIASSLIGGRDYNKRNSGPPLINRTHHHHNPSAHLEPQPYLADQMPYGGYPLDPPHPAMSPMERGDGMPSGHRLGVERGMRNIRFGAGADNGQAAPSSRRSKQGGSRYQDYSMVSNYDTSHYPMSLQPPPLQPPPFQPNDVGGHLDVDLIAHQNGALLHHHHHHHNHSDEYTELQEHGYVDDGSHKGLPGNSSHQHYRAGNGHSRLQHHQQPPPQQNHHHHNSSGRYKNAFNHTGYSRPGAAAVAASAAAIPSYDKEYSNEAAEHEAMLLDLGLTQTQWFLDLQSRGAMIVRVLFTRDANNDKELSVRRGEILEVLDDTRKWWRARNIDLQVAHVPHTIVAVMDGYQTLDELLANSPGNMDESSLINSQQRFSRHNLSTDHDQYQWQDKRNSKAAGAFRYF